MYIYLCRIKNPIEFLIHLSFLEHLLLYSQHFKQTQNNVG